MLRHLAVHRRYAIVIIPALFPLGLLYDDIDLRTVSCTNTKDRTKLWEVGMEIKDVANKGKAFRHSASRVLAELEKEEKAAKAICA